MALTTASRGWRAAQRAALCAALCTFALLIPQFTSAATWAIDPVRIELSPDQQTTAITVRNDSDQATSIQIQAVAWSQHEGKDVYTPTRELLVSPPIVTIPAKGEQVLRVALRRQPDTTMELSYRINLQELPPQPTPGFMGLQVALRIGLPVFVQPQIGKAAARMDWLVSRAPEHKLKVGLKNQGNAHVQITDFSLYVSDAEQPIAGESGSSYVLAGQTREWLVKMGPLEAGERLHLIANTDAGKVDTDLVPDRP